MTKVVEIIKLPRIHLLDFLKDLTTEQLNTVPAGFNNNIIWNLSHMIAAQQGVCYRRAGLNIVVTEEFWKAHAPDTKPEGYIDAAAIARVKELFLSTIDQLATDLETDMFAGYVPWITRYGVGINTIDEAVSFLPFHDGLHLGYIWALKRLV